MRYVQADGDTFIRHIYDDEPTRWDADNFCFARRLTPEQAEKFGVNKLRPVTPPYYDPATQIRYEGDAVLVDGEWLQSWIVADMDAATKTEYETTRITANKVIRNKELLETDWTQLPDVGLTVASLTAFQVYRQALRDLDMLNPDWPVRPQEEWA